MFKFLLYRVHKIFFLVAGTLLSTGLVFAQTFVTIKDPECLSNVGPVFTTGGQYVDPNNGVPDNSWSMLTRWQGNNFVNPVTYDISNFTKMNYSDTGPWAPSAPPVGVPSNWQRGYQPENGTDATPGVQVYCNMVGMILNTWWVPHIPVVGGGYNDMFGYSWSTTTAPDAFVVRGADRQVAFVTDLVVQSDIAVPSVYSYRNPDNPAVPPDRNQPVGQVALFAYILDSSNPNLHPIALVSGTHDTRPEALVAQDYVGCDYSTGVYFASGKVGNTSAYYTADYSTAPQVLPLDRNPVRDPGLPSESYQFFRMRITPANFNALIAKINSTNPSVAGCPANGYSTDISNYRIKYAGLITEMVLTDGRFDSILNDRNKDQMSMGVKAKDVGIYRLVH